ncbi:MAG TPA: glycoside hydrolase family 30 beta sandwich domain-containing protein [Draconibacterium sp.]|nr:glycoside hydrolase family 30 beta sandwich domain-containing protein [Draconibacterium sp.]
MHKLLLPIFVFISFISLGLNTEKNPSQLSKKSTEATFYLTKPDKSVLFEKQKTGIAESTETNLPTIDINTGKTFQEMDGFGFTLTGGSAFHINKMSKEKRQQLLTELFAFDKENIGISYLRISLGASDLDAEVFSYNDLPDGETDFKMEKFSLAPDKKFLIPVLQEILAINPKIKILASPWSPPTWMKTNNATKGGSLKPEFYDAYALYFVKYVQEMQKEGITIDAITVQNEPLHPGNNPSLLMPAVEQADFIKRSLGPAFKAAGINTKIIIYDHNADKPEYPITVLNDPEAKKYIDGSAFHLYGGVIENVSKVHEAHPDKNLYFTEQWIGAPGDFGGDLRWHTKNLIIGASRNWCKTVLEWNLAADPQQEPHTPGGCTQCLGAVTIDGDAVTRNPAYYIVAHASKFVRPGSVRIDSNIPAGLPNVAFKTPEGKIAVIVLNDSEAEQKFNLKVGDKLFETYLSGGSVGTFIL